jgi:uncharacterized membrane protein
MIEDHSGPNWAEIAALVVASVATIGGAGSRVLYWLLGAKINAKSEELHRKIDAQRIDLIQMIAEARNDTSQMISDEMRAMGESLAAIRQKAIDVEIWARDNFVRRDEFQTAMVQLNKRLELTDGKIDRMRDILGDKLDELIRGDTARRGKV